MPGRRYLFQGPIQADGGGDQGEAGEGRRKDDQCLSGGAYLFGAKSYVVGLGEQLIHSTPGHL
jgi:hypothetical protein